MPSETDWGLLFCYMKFQSDWYLWWRYQATKGGWRWFASHFRSLVLAPESKTKFTGEAWKGPKGEEWQERSLRNQSLLIPLSLLPGVKQWTVAQRWSNRAQLSPCSAALSTISPYPHPASTYQVATYHRVPWDLLPQFQLFSALATLTSFIKNVVHLPRII